MNESLRPLSLGEILDRTAQLYRRNFLLFVGVAAAPILVMVALFAGAGALIALNARTAAQGAAFFSGPGGVLLVVGILLVAIPLLFTTTALSQAAMAHTAFQTYTGASIKIRTAFRSVWPNLGRYLWLVILQAVFVVFLPLAAFALIFLLLVGVSWALGTPNSSSGFFLFLVFLLAAAAFVAVILFAMKYAISFAVCVVEGKTAWASLKRAAALSQGARGRIFVMFLVVWALSVILSIAAYVPIVIAVAVVTTVVHNTSYQFAILVVTEILNILLNFSMQTLIMPVYATALVLFYFDQRVRKEGYDIELMMDRAGLTEASESLASSTAEATQSGSAFEGTSAGPVHPILSTDSIEVP